MDGRTDRQVKLDVTTKKRGGRVRPKIKTHRRRHQLQRALCTSDAAAVTIEFRTALELSQLIILPPPGGPPVIAGIKFLAVPVTFRKERARLGSPEFTAG